MVCREETAPGENKKRWFYIALLLCYDLDDYMIHHYIPLTIAAHTMRVMNSLCHCSCALRWLFRGLCAGLLLVPYLAQSVFWIPLIFMLWNWIILWVKSCRLNPHIIDYAGHQCTKMKFVTPCINFQPSFTVISLKQADQGAINSEILLSTAEVFLQCCQLLLVLGNTWIWLPLNHACSWRIPPLFLFALRYYPISIECIEQHKSLSGNIIKSVNLDLWP